MKLCDEELFCSRCYVNGQWLESREGRRLRVFDPASGERIGSVPAFGRSETAAAITPPTSVLVASIAICPTPCPSSRPARCAMPRALKS